MQSFIKKYNPVKVIKENIFLSEIMIEKRFLKLQESHLPVSMLLTKSKKVMDGFQLPQGYSHFKEAVYFLPLISQKFLVLILSTSQG